MAVLGFTRRVDHRFWSRLPDLSLILLVLDEEPNGYAYVSQFGGIGPAAARSHDHWPWLLAHSLRLAAEQGRESVSLVVPGVASAALAYLLERGARYGIELGLFLTSRPFGRLDHYLFSASDALF